MSRMGERARLLESQARCVQRRRATTSRPFPDTHNTKHRIRTPRYPDTSLSLSSPILTHPLYPSQIPVNAFCQGFIHSGTCTLIQFQCHLSVFHPSGVPLAPTLVPALLSQIIETYLSRMLATCSPSTFATVADRFHCIYIHASTDGSD